MERISSSSLTKYLRQVGPLVKQIQRVEESVLVYPRSCKFAGKETSSGRPDQCRRNIMNTSLWI